MNELDFEGLTLVTNQRGRKFYKDEEGELIYEECSGCGEIKKTEKFSKGNSKCKECKRKYRQENKGKIAEQGRKYYKENKGKRAEYLRKYYKENKEKIAEYSRKYRQENKERLLEYKRKYHQENKEKIAEYRQENKERLLEYKRKYRQENPEYAVLQSQRRRARERALPDDFTSKQYTEVLDRFGNACALSGESDDVHFDHVIPISIGHGGTTIGNMIPLDATLNVSKSASNVFEWFADNKERFGLRQDKFDEMVSYLAEVNEMTTQEYHDYVYDCFENPKEIKLKQEA